MESKGGFDNAIEWLNKASKINTSDVQKVADAGTTALKRNTPRDTGATADGWKANVKMTAKGVEISWTNDAHPGESVNMAKLIELGHGTRTGGYVSPRPFIKQSMDSVFKTAGDKIAGELFKK